MHKFIFPTKDSLIYELSSSVNYGGDEILELRKDFNMYKLRRSGNNLFPKKRY